MSIAVLILGESGVEKSTSMRNLSVDEISRAFYQECADIEGISLDCWLESAERGEF